VGWFLAFRGRVFERYHFVGRIEVSYYFPSRGVYFALVGKIEFVALACPRYKVVDLSFIFPVPILKIFIFFGHIVVDALLQTHGEQAGKLKFSRESLGISN
jgi:hypothetical protein